MFFLSNAVFDLLVNFCNRLDYCLLIEEMRSICCDAHW